MNKFTIILLLFFSFFLSSKWHSPFLSSRGMPVILRGVAPKDLYAKSIDLCALTEKELRNEDDWIAAIRSAISAEQKLVELSVISYSPITDGQVTEAATSALQSAFRRIVERGSQGLVPASRLSEAASLIEKKIYDKPRLFILNFRRLRTEICDDKEYRIMIKATLKLQGLRESLLNHGIISFEFLTKKIRISNVSRAKDYLAIRDLLQRRIPNLKRLVEIYQKRGEVEFLIETPAGWDEIRARLVRESGESEDIPKFQLLYDEEKGLELKLL